MGCRSDYMDQTPYEKAVTDTAELLLFVKKSLKLKITEEEKEIAKDYYPSKANGDSVTVTLCKILSELPEELLNNVVYDAKNKTSRKLADWWESHLEADKERIAKEKKELEENNSKLAKEVLDKKVKKAALAKLTPDERRVLGV